MGGYIGSQTRVALYDTYTRAEVTGFDRAAVNTALKHAAIQSGLTLVNGSFEMGATVTTSTQVVWFEVEGSFYSWAGTLPKVVTAGSTPTTSGGISSTGWVNQYEGIRRVATDTQFLSTGYILLPSGTTAQRPTSPVNGMVRYNTDVGFYEYYRGGAWQGAGGADSVFTGGSIQLPPGTTAQRPVSPVNGMIRYNTDTQSFEGYVNSQWGGVGGANANGAIYENSQLINTSYTITAGKNGFSAGPISISNGVTVGIPTGSTWVVA